MPTCVTSLLLDLLPYRQTFYLRIFQKLVGVSQSCAGNAMSSWALSPLFLTRHQVPSATHVDYPLTRLPTFVPAVAYHYVPRPLDSGDTGISIDQHLSGVSMIH